MKTETERGVYIVLQSLLFLNLSLYKYIQTHKHINTKQPTTNQLNNTQRKERNLNILCFFFLSHYLLSPCFYRYPSLPHTHIHFNKITTENNFCIQVLWLYCCYCCLFSPDMFFVAKGIIKSVVRTGDRRVGDKNEI